MFFFKNSKLKRQHDPFVRLAPSVHCGGSELLDLALLSFLHLIFLDRLCPFEMNRGVRYQDDSGCLSRADT